MNHTEGYADLARKAKQKTPRKEWLKQQSGTNHIMTEEEKQQIQSKPFDPSYEEHLAQLSKRNKLIRDLQSKDDDQIELERREQGFSIYVNGANATGIRRQKVVTKHTPRPSFQKPKTAESFRPLDEKDDFRHLSAPERGRRKQWSQKGVTLKTNEGNIYTRAADYYTEDFDMSGDSLEPGDRNNDDEDEDEIDEDIEEVYGCMRQLGLDDCVNRSRMLLSIDDVKELRRSLVKSLDVGTSFRFNKDNSVCEFSPISSLDEDDEEEIEEESENEDVDMSLDVQQTGKHTSPWKPGDMIVLEFAPKVAEKRELKASARKVKRSWENDQLSVPKSQPRASSPIDQSPEAVKPTVQSESSAVQSPSATSPPTDQLDSVPAKVEQVVEQVLQMEPSQQQKFWDMIQKIDPSSSDENLDKDAEQRQSKITMNRTFTPEPSNELRLELVTNWGHENRIGLTEIHLFDMDNVKLTVTPDSVRLEHGDDQSLSSLFNGKYKTTKDRNMWSAAYEGKPISILFDLAKMANCTGKVDPDPCDLVKKIKIWNYNKSLTDLNVGVKDVRILLGCQVLYEGQIEKGCGNQVFDYGNNIDLRYDTDMPDEAENSAEKLETEVIETDVHRSEKFGSGDVPMTSDSKNVKMSPKKSLKNNPDERVVESMDFGKSLANKRKIHDRVTQSSEISRSAGKSREKPLRSSVSGSSSKRVTSPRTEESSRKIESQARPTSKNSKRRMMANFSGTPQSRDLCDEDTAAQDDDSMLQQLRTVKKEPSKKQEKSLRLSDDSGTLADWPNRGLEEMPSELTDTKPRRVLSGRRAKADSPVDGGATPRPKPDLGDSDASFTPFPARDSMHARAQWRQNCERSLEESWSSLNLFNQNHRGRISTALEDDVMDDYLHQDKKSKFDETVPSMDTNATQQTAESNEHVFTIPELPSGRVLEIDIRTTWGDKHYLGLTGIDIFTEKGPRPTVQKITADPSDINTLPEYSQDPRVVSNLLDGVNQTRDDTHMWLAPFSSGRSHTITITFDKVCTIALLRFWNYNKSRIHSYRGARDVLIKLDDKLIFDGEISRASGGLLGGMENFGETILFTMDEDILEKVSAHDDALDLDADWSDEENEAVADERPRTADQSEERPLTHALRTTKPADPISSMDMQIAEIMESRDFSTNLVVEPKTMDSNTNEEEVKVFRGRVIRLNFTQTWGDLHYLGLTGLSLVGPDGDIDITRDMLEANPQDLTSLPGCQDDLRTLDKLVDGVNITMLDSHMWLIPFTNGQDHVVTITLPKPRDVIGVRIWNYNKNPDDTYRGAKIVHASLDNKQISPQNGYLIRKGPGNCFFDFAQEILFTTKDNISSTIARSKQLMLPCGFIYQFHLVNTWGDQYYVGLNGLEIYDEYGKKMTLDENNIAAYPDSVNVLDDVCNDVRTPDKLINGVNSSADAANSWLAPIIPSLINRIFVIFDKPTPISLIKLWNYSKTPNRGVRDFGLYVDDLLVYNGTLDTCSQAARGILPGMSVEQAYHTVLFTNDERIVKREKHSIIRSKVAEQDVQMTNDRNIVTHYSGQEGGNVMKDVDQSLRPVTAVNTKSKRQR